MGWFSSIVKSVFKAVASVVRAIVDVIVDVVRAVVNALVALVKWIVQVIAKVITWFLGLFGNTFGWIIAIIILILVAYFCPPCLQFLIDIMMAIWDAIVYIYELVSTALTYVWEEFLVPMWNGLVNAASGLWDWVSSIASKAWGLLQSAAGFLWDVAKSVGSAIESAISWVAKIVGENPVLAGLLAASALGINWTYVAIGGAIAGYLYLTKDDNPPTRVELQQKGT